VRISSDVAANSKFSLVVFSSRHSYCLQLLLFHSSTLLNIQNDSSDYSGLSYICLIWFSPLHLVLCKNGTQISPFCSLTTSKLLLLIGSPVHLCHILFRISSLCLCVFVRYSCVCV